MRKFNLRSIQLQSRKLYYKKKFYKEKLCKTTISCYCYISIEKLIMQSYSLKRKQKNKYFKQSKTFVLFKQKTNISRNLFIITRLEQLVCVISTKTISIAKITN